MTRERGIIKFFDKLEDKVRISLSHRPILYALIGGIGVVLFWKGVWETAEAFPVLFGLPSAILGTVIMLMTGLFVSFFIGDSILLSGFKHQKKIADKTEEEVVKDVDITQTIKAQLDVLAKEIAEIKAKLSQTQ
ncbi:MAG TPA: hypothetical protein VHD31_01055 [Candidatus Paceibacterota bacterium]|nr:hypothetical protein [Candidatus Paceibacterota bacterium]